MTTGGERWSRISTLPEPGADLVKGGLHDPGPDVDPDGSRTPIAEHVDRFADWVMYRYRDAERRPHNSVGCIYSWLPDARFHLQRHGRVVVASCCSGRGFKFTPLTGLRTANLVEDILTGDGAPGAAATTLRASAGGLA